MASPLEFEVKYSGPFFLPGAAGKAQEAVQKTVADLTIEGERQVKLQLTPGHGVESGHYSRSVHGEMTASMHGIITDSNVVYGPWLEGVGSRNRTTRFKGYAMFRKAYQQLEKLAGKILQDRVNELTRRLGG